MNGPKGADGDINSFLFLVIDLATQGWGLPHGTIGLVLLMVVIVHSLVVIIAGSIICPVRVGRGGFAFGSSLRDS